jgi:hypothetical protein
VDASKVEKSPKSQLVAFLKAPLASYLKGPLYQKHLYLGCFACDEHNGISTTIGKVDWEHDMQYQWYSALSIHI